MDLNERSVTKEKRLYPDTCKTKNWVRETERKETKKSKETGRVISRVDPQWDEGGT